MNTYMVHYTDSRMGEATSVEVEAEDRGEAIEIAMEDYYFGRLLGVDEY